MVNIKVYSSDFIYEYLGKTVSYSEEECQAIYSNDERTFYDPDTYACEPVSGNIEG